MLPRGPLPSTRDGSHDPSPDWTEGAPAGFGAYIVSVVGAVILIGILKVLGIFK
jgi:hypothetical protein